jgi:hypothetical protein
MSGFFERDKKKGALSSALQDRRVLAGLLLSAAAVLSFIFIAPSDLIKGSVGSWTRLTASFSAAKRGQGLSWTALFSRGPVVLSSSSLDFVSGSAAELGLAAGGAAKTVRGILTPEDAARAGPDVALADADLAGQRAAAGELTYANRGFFTGGPGAVARAGEELRGAFAGSGEVPVAGSGRGRGVSSGRLTRAKGDQLSARLRASIDQNLLAGGAKSVSDLTQARQRAGVLLAPTCSKAESCSGEFVSANSGAVYDGNPVGAGAPSALSSPGFDGASKPSAAETRAGDEAQKAQQDLLACQKADADYTAQEAALGRDMQDQIERYRAQGCPPFWGGQARRLCDEQSAEALSACRRYDLAKCAHQKACPLTAAEGCAQTDCDSLLPGSSLQSFFSGLF